MQRHLNKFIANSNANTVQILIFNEQTYYNIPHKQYKSQRFGLIVSPSSGNQNINAKATKYILYTMQYLKFKILKVYVWHATSYMTTEQWPSN